MPTTHCLPLRFLPPRVTDLADVGLHIFNHFFSSRIRQSARFSPSFVIFLSYGHAYRAFSLRFSLFPSFSALPPKRVRVSPRKVDIFVRKKERKKRGFVTRSTRRVASGPRLQTKRCRANERTSARTERMVEQKGVEGGATGERREKGERIESKTATVAKGK